MLGTQFLKSDIVGANTVETQVREFAKAAAWCKKNNAEIVEDGDYFVVATKPEHVMTPEEIQKSLVDAIQVYMNAEAQKLRYDDIFTAISYEGDANPKFAAEAAAFKEWRSAVWTYCYAYLDEVIAGTKEIPTLEQLIAGMPVLNIVYGD